MPLTAGTRLGVFEILAPLGKGGMGEVYRAKDTKLEREVAVKILPEEMAKRPERMARFQREAKLLAALDHPHIAAIHGLHEEDGQHFLVMELVDGETLADRLKRGALPVQDALELGRQIAEALEAAHDKDIIHRDLKPSNVMLTSKGRAKVLDFGLGRVLEREAFVSSIETGTTPDETGTGVVVGTAPYMSPEQARGEDVNQRTDIWSFGCVLFEMLSGKRAFPGATTSDAIAAVLEHEPEWGALPETAGTIARSLLRQCLRKNKARRLHDIADARIELEEALGEAVESTGTATPRARRSRWHWIAYGLAGSLVATALVMGWGSWGTAPPTQQATHTTKRLTVAIPRDASLGTSGSSNYVGISPDGARLAYTGVVDGVPGLFLHPLDQLQGTRIAGTESAINPFFSPGGSWLGFHDATAGTLRKVSIDGGATVPICDTNMRGATWRPDGTILFTPDDEAGLWSVPAEGGIPVELTRADPDQGGGHRWPDFLPGGQAALFTVAAPSSRQDESRIALVSLETGEWRVLFEGGSFGRYVGTGHIVYARNGSLLAVPFDLERLEVTGAAVQILDDVWMEPVGALVAQFAISQTGALVYITSLGLPERSLVWVDRRGRVEPVMEERRAFASPSLSPDGERLAVTVWTGMDRDIWLYDLSSGTRSRLTFEKDNLRPVWMSDGRHVVFSSNRQGGSNLFRKSVDGSRETERLMPSMSGWQFATSVSPDGRFLAFMQEESDTQQDIWVLPLGGDGEREPQLIVRTRFFDGQGAFSPDGRWLAYVSDESGRYEVYVRPFPDPGRRWQVSTNGGREPLWSQDGRELFFREGGTMGAGKRRKLMSVLVRTQPTFQAGSPQLLFEGRYLDGRMGPPEYDVAPDGQRFLMVQLHEEATVDRKLVYIPDFFDELKAKMAEAGQ